jgi:hypothetical protein
VRGALAVHGGELPPELLAEAIGFDGRLSVRRAAGELAGLDRDGGRRDLPAPDHPGPRPGSAADHAAPAWGSPGPWARTPPSSWAASSAGPTTSQPGPT